MSQSNASIEVQDLIKTYNRGRVTALDGVTISINKGEIFGLIGPNGAGKTTLIGCLLGLLRPDSGTISIDGRSPDYLSVHQIVGYVPERPEFEYWMTARQFLLYHHGLCRRDPAAAEEEITAALQFVELPAAAWQRRLKTYSRGMLQRLNLAQLTIGKPSLLLLDEPSLGLDPTGVAVVRKLVNSARAAGATAIINSHQLDEIERLCDRVAFIKHGKIASIHTLKGGELCDYVLSVKWTGSALDGQAGGRLKEVSHRVGAELKETTDGSARFAVKDANLAAQLIKELVEAGFAVAEAVPERARLEQLFVSTGEEDTDE